METSGEEKDLGMGMVNTEEPNREGMESEMEHGEGETGAERVKGQAK